MAAPPLDDDDLLSEIILRLPPQPSSLPRASAVAKRWRSLASDPAFSRRFLRHHRRNPPLLGCFMEDVNEFRFESTLESPNRVPRARFSFPTDTGDGHLLLLGCRHGLLLLLHASQQTTELFVWDPVESHKHPIAIPPGFSVNHGAVLPAAHGDIQNFQVVLVSIDVEHGVVARVYSSETGVWGDLITTPFPPNVSDLSPAQIARHLPAVLVGDALYMSLLGVSSGIIEFNVHMQSLAVVPLPVGLDSYAPHSYSLMRAEGGGPGLLYLSMSGAQFWKRKTDCDGVASWVLGRTIALENLLCLDVQNRWVQIQGFAEENNVVFLWAFDIIFMIQLDSLQCKKLPEINSPNWYPFECVYAAGI
ncbi:unnamed protein product [Alopecurus aequalis]